MNNSDKETPLIIHTLDTLCKELVSGRTILLDDQGSKFKLNSPETRSLFGWYIEHKDKWAKPNRKEDVEALVDQLEKNPPEFPVTKTADNNHHKNIININKITAHRFAGIHHFGTVENPPDDFEFDLDKSLTLIEGTNGSGKTSFLNAISWCLSGYIYRSQREPEKAEQSVELEISDKDENTISDEIKYDMSPITPLPSKEILESLGENSLPLDTWVELTLEDDKGIEVGKIKRSLTRTNRGNLKESLSGFSKLRLDPIAFEVGTKMPGLIPYIQPDRTCDMGRAVSELTGIKQLEYLVEHVGKSIYKLKKVLVDDRKVEIDNLKVDYLTTREELLALILEQPDIDPKVQIPKPEPEKTVEEALEICRNHFEKLQVNYLEKSRTILGDSFNPDDEKSREDLYRNIGPARGCVDRSSIGRLPSALRFHKLGCLKDNELFQTENLIQKLKEEAIEIANLDKKPNVAARLRLFARIANWIKEHEDEQQFIENCPVCFTSLKGKMDEKTGKSISDQINYFLNKECEYIGKTIIAWEDDALADLSKNLPETLQSEMNKDLPEKPFDLIKESLSSELFEPIAFEGCLAFLQQTTKSLCQEINKTIPRFQEPEVIVFPDCFKKDEDSISNAINRILRAIAFSHWRKNNIDTCKELFTKIIGEGKALQESIISELPIEKWPLCNKLNSLNEMVINVKPLIEAIKKINSMQEKLKEIRKKEERIELYSRTADALSELTGLGILVKLQVESLISLLSKETIQWKNNFYLPAYVGAPCVENTDVGTDGSLNIDAVAKGTKASALHISNSSDLRATLLAFLIAFWNHLLITRGGISILLLDEPQELFDINNRRRVANSVNNITENGGKVIVTTSDTTFGRSIHDSFNKTERNQIIDHRHIHPINENRQHIDLGPYVENIQEKKEEFERPENQNVNKPAQDYIEELRIYLENRLLDFFEKYEHDLPKKPTLSDLINAIRSRRNNGVVPFNHQVFEKLLEYPSLKKNSKFIQLMNKSHHGGKDDIVFNEVWQVKDDCDRVRKLVLYAHEDYERWLRRDSRDITFHKPKIPHSIKPPSIEVPLIENLAAFTTEESPTDLLESEDSFSTNLLNNHAIYFINTHNFGFSGKINCRAIVDLNTEEIPPDNSLVIALYNKKVYARRLHRYEQHLEYITLSSDSENPTKRSLSLSLPSNEVRLLKVVGILFDYSQLYPRSSEEAVLENNTKYLEKIEITFKVIGNSALPLALPGQIILGGKCLMNNQLNEMEGSFVAIETSDRPAFKRIGESVSGIGNIRNFESIGGLGESILVKTEDIEDSFTDLPLLSHTRQILGVLYELNKLNGDMNNG